MKRWCVKHNQACDYANSNGDCNVSACQTGIGGVGKMTKKLSSLKKDIRKAQAEAVKEFAEKMKKQIANTMYCRDGYVDYDDTMDVIDELLKEFLKQ